jgi:hypothetical protein
MLDFQLRTDRLVRIPTLANYDQVLLAQPRWPPTTLCGREWSMMVGSDGGSVSEYRDTAYAPTCRRCLTTIDRNLPKPATDQRLHLVARLAADKVLETGHTDIRDVPGDQQQARGPRSRHSCAGRPNTASAPIDHSQDRFSSSATSFSTNCRAAARPRPWRHYRPVGAGVSGGVVDLGQ